MKYFALRHNVVGAVMRCIPQQRKLTQLAGIAFVRSVITTKDEMYLRQIVRGNHLRPLMKMLRDGSNKDDMVSSAILELVLLCCDLDLDLVIRHLANSHLDCLSDPLHHHVKVLLQAVASGSTESSVNGNRSPRSPAISLALSDTPNMSSGALSLQLPGTISRLSASYSQESSSSDEIDESPPHKADSVSALGGSGTPLSPGVRQFRSGTNGGTLLALAYGQAAHETFPALGMSPRKSDSQGITDDNGSHLVGSLGSEEGPLNKSSLSPMALNTSEKISPGACMGRSGTNSALGGDSSVDDPLTEAAPWAHNTSPRSPLSPVSRDITVLSSSVSSCSDASIHIPRAHHQPLIRTRKGRLPLEDSLSLQTSRYLLSRTRWEALPRQKTKQIAVVRGKEQGSALV